MRESSRYEDGIKEEIDISFSPLQELDDVILKSNNIRLFLKRDDLIQLKHSGHTPSVNGNKWRKLKYNIRQLKALGHTQMLTFGGAFSNHIHAVAAAGDLFNIKTIGVIRGERATPLSTTLTFAESKSMYLHFISRNDYRHKTLIIKELEDLYGPFYLLPEGGTNTLAVKGCEEIVMEINAQLAVKPDFLSVPCGTGGTISGLIAATEQEQKVEGFPVLKDASLYQNITVLTEGYDIKCQWSLNENYHFGGYAKWTPELIEFINNFKIKFGIPLDPIYTGKMMFGIFDKIKNGLYPKGSTIVAIHTGGLQGIEGFNNFILKKRGLRIY